MNKICNKCSCELLDNNSVKIKSGRYIRNVCKSCRVKQVVESNRGNEKRKEYVRMYLRRTGKVKEYPCEYCKKLCFKKYLKAFCSDECRFMSKVLITSSCWIWNAFKNKNGYGRISLKDKKSNAAHRVSYILFKGQIPDNMYVCHTCDIPSCVNPAHLWLGTTQENTLDMVNKGRSLFGEKHNKSKLIFSDIIRIRDLDIKGWTQKKIGEIYNITSGHVNNIVKKRVWKHV